MSDRILPFKPRASRRINDAGQAYASGKLSEYMLMELALEVARKSPDAQGKLAELFDRVATRARLGSIATDKDSVMQFRKAAESFFILAGTRLSRAN